MNEQKAFESWAVVELFGHNVIAGQVTEQVIAGQGFIRVDVPEVAGQPAFTKLYGPSTVYGITPCTEAFARQAAGGLRVKPINLYELHVPLPGPRQMSLESGPGDDDEDWGEG